MATKLTEDTVTDDFDFIVNECTEDEERQDRPKTYANEDIK